MVFRIYIKKVKRRVVLGIVEDQNILFRGWEQVFNMLPLMFRMNFFLKNG